MDARGRDRHLLSGNGVRPDQPEVGFETSGTVSVEYSGQTYEDWIEAAMCGTYDATPTDLTDLAVTAGSHQQHRQVPAGQQGVDNVATDEAGTTENRNSHRATSSVSGLTGTVRVVTDFLLPFQADVFLPQGSQRLQNKVIEIYSV